MKNPTKQDFINLIYDIYYAIKDDKIKIKNLGYFQGKYKITIIDDNNLLYDKYRNFQEVDYHKRDFNTIDNKCIVFIFSNKSPFKSEEEFYSDDLMIGNFKEYIFKSEDELYNDDLIICNFKEYIFKDYEILYHLSTRLLFDILTNKLDEENMTPSYKVIVEYMKSLNDFVNELNRLILSNEVHITDKRIYSDNIDISNLFNYFIKPQHLILTKFGDIIIKIKTVIKKPVRSYKELFIIPKEYYNSYFLNIIYCIFFNNIYKLKCSIDKIDDYDDDYDDDYYVSASFFMDCYKDLNGINE